MDTTESLDKDGLSKFIFPLKQWLLWLFAFTGMVFLVFVYFGEIQDQTTRTNRSQVGWAVFFCPPNQLKKPSNP